MLGRTDLIFSDRVVYCLIPFPVPCVSRRINLSSFPFKYLFSLNIQSIFKDGYLQGSKVTFRSIDDVTVELESVAC